MGGWQFGGWPPPPPSADTVTFAEVQAALAAATGPVSFNGQRITNLGNGVNPTDGAAFGQIPVVTGFVTGPASATDNALARFDLATGKLIQDSVVTLSDAGALAGVLSVDGVTLRASAAPTQVAIGNGATGNFGTASGVDTLALGQGVLASLTTGTQNTAVGSACVLLGLPATGAALTTGLGNTLLGAGAGCALVDGNTNTLVGLGAGRSAVSANSITAVGSLAAPVATASPNDAFGGNSLRNTTTGINNVGIGNSAGQLITTGSENTLLGTESLAGTTATRNVAVGFRAGRALLTGTDNVAIGTRAMLTGSGNNNVVIGSSVGGVGTGTRSNNILIGAGVGSPNAGADNQLSLGNLIFGDLSTISVRIGGSGSLAAQTSKLLIVNAGADTVPVLELSSTGANGATTALRAGTQAPGGVVSGNAGDLYVRKNGATSGVYVNISAADPGTTWALLL